MAQQYVNQERTVLVRVEDDGRVTVALREDSDALWGPPIEAIPETQPKPTTVRPWMPKPSGCIECGNPHQITDKDEGPGSTWTPAGRREIAISGMCESCFDRLFKEPTES